MNLRLRGRSGARKQNGSVSGALTGLRHTCTAMSRRTWAPCSAVGMPVLGCLGDVPRSSAMCLAARS